MKKLLLILSMIFISSIQIFSENDTIPVFRLVTEDFSPYNFLKEKEPVGISVELLQEILKRSGSRQKIGTAEFFPWARAYYIAQNNPNTILFITARTKEREGLFKWVGPVFTDKTEVFALRNKNIIIHSVEDLKKYSIASYIGDYEEEIIKELGIPQENLDRVTSSEARLKKVYSGRTDLVFVNKSALIDFTNRENINPYVFQSVYQLKGVDMCYALAPDTPDWIVEKMQQALNELHEEGFVSNLFKKYGFEDAYYIEK